MLKLLLLSLVLTCSVLCQFNPYNITYFCSSTCIDYTGACYDQTPQGCFVCAISVYNMNPTLGTSCVTAAQNNLLAYELSNTNMSLFGYTTSNPTPYTCTNYTFSGQYNGQDYISKNFTGIPLNHYAIVVRFNVAYLGQWDRSDVLSLALEDQLQITYYDYNYSCDVTNSICGTNASDCVRIRQYTLTHNTSYVFLNFTALINTTNTSFQSWGIKELIVSAKECHSYCQTCYGGANTNCLSCASGYYLQGNTCLPVCQKNLYTVAPMRSCVSSCPSGYYKTTDTNGKKICAACQTGCSLCSSQDICQAWEGQSAYLPDLWKDKMEFWLLLIIIVILVLVALIYKIVKSALAKPTSLEEKLHGSTHSNGDEKLSGKSSSLNKSKKSSDSDQNGKDYNAQSKMHLQSQGMVAGDSIALPDSKLWFNQLVQLEPTEVKVTRPRRKRRSPPTSEQQGSITQAVQIASGNNDL